MMQIVIEIPEEKYNRLMKQMQLDRNFSECKITPLPKGHGRLIDADALSKDDDVTEWLSLNAVRTGKMLKRFSELFIKKINDAPTIIEADKAERKVEE